MIYPRLVPPGRPGDAGAAQPLEKAWVIFQSSHTTAISDGLVVVLDVTRSVIEERAYMIRLAGTSGTVSRHAVGVTMNNKDGQILPGEWGLVQTYGYAEGVASDSSGWAAVDVVLRVVNTSGILQDTGHPAVVTTHDVGEIAATTVAESGGGISSVFIRRM